MLRREFLKALGVLPFVPSVLKGDDTKEVAVLKCLLAQDKALIDSCSFNIRDMEDEKYIRQMLRYLFCDEKSKDYGPVKVVSMDLGEKDGFINSDIILYCTYGESMKEKGSVIWVRRNKEKVVYDYNIRSSVLTLYTKRERQLDKILFED